MIKKWYEFIFDHRISLRERMFRITTGGCMISAIFVLPMGKSAMNWLILAVSLIFMAVTVKISIEKDRINTGGTVIYH